ncbi:hypothetical protein [Bradyrhizobium sp. USDA 4452]
MATPVTDPALLAQLNGSLEPKPVTDPALLEQLNAGHTPGDIAVDVAKSGGIGAIKGGIGLVGAAGDLRNAASASVDWAAGKLGLDPSTIKHGAETLANMTPVGSVLTRAPSSHDIQSGIEGVTGEFYKPKTTAGEYAQTAGEFLPAMIGGPESLASRAVTRVALPAIASETAGQITKGTEVEPWARTAAALLSPVATSTARRAITPLPATAERTALANALRGEGVDLTAGQATGNKPLMWLESALGDIPGSGGAAARMQEAQGQQFTAAALRRAGENANRATPEVIDRAFHRIGADFDTLSARNTLHMDPQFVTDIVDTAREYHALVPPAMRSPIVENIVRDIGQTQAHNAGQISGEAYQALTSRLERAARGSNDPQLRAALRGIRGSLDDAMERSIAANNPADAGAWQQARTEYRNLMVLEKAATAAGSSTAEGLISPSSLRNATINTQGRRNYARGNGDFADLARAGEAIMKPLPNSGTAPRMYAQHFASALSGGLGATVAGLPGMLAGATMPALVGRALLSAPVQRYLSNQAVLPTAGAGAARQALARALLGAQSARLLGP